MTDIFKEINALYTTYPALFTIYAVFNAVTLVIRLVAFGVGVGSKKR